MSSTWCSGSPRRCYRSPYALVVSRFDDATVVVVDSRSTARKGVRRTLQMLDQIHAPVLGVVFNGAPVGGGYGYASDTPKRTVRRRMAVPTSR